MAFFGKYYFVSSHAVPGKKDANIPQAMRAAEWEPPTDIYETEDALVILMELAGVESSDTVVILTGQELVVRGIRREARPRCKKSYRQMEIHHGPFERTIELPVPVEGKKAKADFHDGFLEILLPRATKPAKNKRQVRIEWQFSS